MNDNFTKQRGVILGFPFDQLFDRNCDLEYWRVDTGQKKRLRVPALKLPTDVPGTGNIIITGPPGSGKSTLALQWAVKCAMRDDNQSNAAFFSLESSLTETAWKATPFGWHKWLRLPHSFEGCDETATPEAMAESLAHLLDPMAIPPGTGAQASPPKPPPPGPKGLDSATGDPDLSRRVLLCSLSPRPLDPHLDPAEFFWRRYHQVEQLLAAADHLSTPHHPEGTWRNAFLQRCLTRENNQPADRELSIPGTVALPVFVIDSLNMFTSRPLLRDELLCLFGLFRKYGRIGVFVVESEQDTPFDSTMAEVVVSLSNQKDRGYHVQYFEIQKSRYYNHVPGLHPYKTYSPRPNVEPEDTKIPPMPTEKGPCPPRNGIVVYPSLHYVVLHTEQSEEQWRAREAATGSDYFGIDALRDIFPRGLRRGSVVTIEGPSGTFKTSLALNFLGTGLKDNESGLLIRLTDMPLLQTTGSDTNQLAPQWSSLELAPRFKWTEFNLWTAEEADGGKWSNLAARHKTAIHIWRRSPPETTPPSSRDALREKMEPSLIELSLKGGALLPEECVELIRDILNRRDKHDCQRMKRVVLTDVSQIGVSYPFLRQSITTGGIFLPAFVHIMRNAGVDLVMTATTTGLAPADEMVSRAHSLADAVLSCRFCDVYGERQVTVSRGGLTAGSGETTPVDEEAETVPAVIQIANRDKYIFHLNPTYLGGLVGFESGHIHRPGLIMHLFQDNERVHGKYNQEIRTMLLAAFAASNVSRSRQADESGSVDVVPFTAGQSEAIHTAISRYLERERPLDRTVLFTVDEFGAPILDLECSPSQWISVPEGSDPDGLHWEHFLISKDVDSPYRLGEKAWPGCFWPYYSNVLLIAYRQDALADATPPPTTWAQVRDLAQVILARRNDLPKQPQSSEPNDRVPAIERGFWVDLSAPESLACVLLDALCVANRGQNFTFLTARKIGSILSGPETQQLEALQTIFQQMTGPIAEVDNRLLPENVGLYVCWYSQLRELIDRKPALATKLNVCPLPGGGFRGDWFAGIIRGSVSPALGRQIISILCGKEEDHKRYVRGVGLPARHEFYSEQFYAWPRASHVTMPHMRQIWKGAHRRSAIWTNQGYQRVRSNISAMAKQLSPAGGPVLPEWRHYHENKTLLQVVDFNRLFDQIACLLQ